MIEIYDVWLRDPEDGFIRIGSWLSSERHILEQHFQIFPCGGALILL